MRVLWLLAPALALGSGSAPPGWAAAVPAEAGPPLPGPELAAQPFWSGRPRQGANCMNATPPPAAYFRAAHELGIEWIRLAYDKWKPAGRDFLLGNVDRYQGLVPADLAILKATLDRAQAEGVKVVLAPLSLPGMRWSQNNGGRFDGRIWRDRGYWEQAAGFWRDLALALKDHPAVVAYNLVNEPAPERDAGLGDVDDPVQARAWYAKVRGSARDLPAFYELVAGAIRAVEPRIPIMVDAGSYGRPTAFAYWPGPVAGDQTLYAFHMYEPYRWSSPENLQRSRPFGYPGSIPTADGRQQTWGRAEVARFMQTASDWAKAQGIPPGRLVVAEFGCHRRAPGAAAYLEDVLAAVAAQGSHWAFYAFREQPYDGYDYELGREPLPAAYWQAEQRGQSYPVQRAANPIFAPIQSRLRPPAPGCAGCRPATSPAAPAAAPAPAAQP